MSWYDDAYMCQATPEAQFIKNLSNNDAEANKSVAFKKNLYLHIIGFKAVISACFPYIVLFSLQGLSLRLP